MPTLESFFIENEVKSEPIEIVVSERFVDKTTGEPEVWKIAPVSAEDDRYLRKACSNDVQNPRTGMMSSVLDQDDYMVAVASAGVIYPNLLDEKLLKNRGAKTGSELLRKLLNVGEMNKLALKVMEISGMTDDELLSPMERDINTAKN